MEASTRSVRVSYRVLLGRAVASELVRALVRQVLYMRGQLPCVYEQLRSSVDRYHRERDGGGRESYQVERATRCVDSLELLQSRLAQVFSSSFVRRVALVFGKSVHAPEEVWFIDISSSDDMGQRLLSEEEEVDGAEEGDEGPPESSKVTGLCVQKLMRALFAYDTSLLSAPLEPTLGHLLLLVDDYPSSVHGLEDLGEDYRVQLPERETESKTHVVMLCDCLNRTEDDGCHCCTKTPWECAHDVDDRDRRFRWVQYTRSIPSVSDMSPLQV